MEKSRICKIEIIENKASSPTHWGWGKNTKGIGHSDDKTTFTLQLQRKKLT